MQITKQRLDEIIEEEVIRFKRLNEDTPLAQDPAMIAFNAQMDRIKNIASRSKEEAARVTGILNGVK